MTRPTTPADIAEALRVIAGQIADMPNPDQPLGGHLGTFISVGITVKTPAEVDAFSQALYGQPGHPQEVSTGWHHTSPRGHDTKVTVAVLCVIEDPAVTRLKEENERLRAEASREPSHA